MNDAMLGDGFDIWKCRKKCNYFRYIGIQNGDECHCSNSYLRSTQFGASTECTDGTGGVLVISLYENTLYSQIPHSYIPVFQTMDWLTANAHCVSTYGTSLAIVETKQNLNFFSAVKRTSKNFWCGLNDLDGDGNWSYPDGSSPPDDVYEGRSWDHNMDTLCAIGHTDWVGNLRQSRCSWAYYSVCEAPTYQHDGCYHTSDSFAFLDVDKGIEQTVETCDELCDGYPHFVMKNGSLRI